MKIFIAVHLCALALASSTFLKAANASSEESIAGSASIIDGDTIEIHDKRVRLFGIDAPESQQLCTDQHSKEWRCGQKASLALSDFVGRSPVSCRQNDTDRYGRIVATCVRLSDGVELNRWMVKNGWAVAYTKYSSDYLPEERGAKSSKIGIWSGSFQIPSEWRHSKIPGSRATEGSSASKECNIKGNIGKHGKKIYHMPGMRWYQQTAINVQDGERWFCSEAEALAAGWQRSGQ